MAQKCFQMWDFVHKERSIRHDVSYILSTRIQAYHKA